MSDTKYETQATTYDMLFGQFDFEPDDALLCPRS
jgi:hypothetical protein